MYLCLKVRKGIMYLFLVSANDEDGASIFEIHVFFIDTYRDTRAKQNHAILNSAALFTVTDDSGEVLPLVQRYFFAAATR